MSAEQWLSYSNADQAVLRDQDRGRLWDRLVVPGTLATYYAKGTSSFVAALKRPFIVDPRTPLLQPVTVNRPEPRESHKTLARIHDPEAVELWAKGEEVPVGWWSEKRWRACVERVLAFQESFEDLSSPQIKKYREMLAEAGSFDELTDPFRYVPPYWAVTGAEDEWWRLSLAAIEQAVERHGGRVMPILCLRREADPETFRQMISQLPEPIDYVACWWGRWDEAKATRGEIGAWVDAGEAGRQSNIRVINMYGGGLTTLLCGLSLAGIHHGIGYSESRDERRLGDTGAPPTRYYIPRLRMFLPVPQAEDALSELGPDYRCGCPLCKRNNGTPIGLTADELKAHFLEARAAELRKAQDDIAGEVSKLNAVAEDLVERFFSESEDAPNVWAHLFGRGQTLDVWVTGVNDYL
jgi:hypothetical protein